jgi:cell division protein FtsB
MPPGPRPTSRPGAGPGRGKPRTRVLAKKSAASSSATAAASAGQPTSEPAERVTPAVVGRLASNLTTRAIALAVVVLILTISYASSLRIYLAQRQEIASTRVEISQREARITDLQAELARWDDAAYVRTQARARLGWVMPGETGYKVVDSEGNPIGGGAQINAARTEPKPVKDAWWSKLWGSVEAADRPAPKKQKEKPAPPITVDSTPSASSTPR